MILQKIQRGNRFTSYLPDNIQKYVPPKFYPLLSCALFISFMSCKKLVSLDPPINSINVENVYKTDATASAVLTGIYTTMAYSNTSEFSIGGFTSLSLFPALSADELKLFDSDNLVYFNYYDNSLASIAMGGTADYWSTIYPIVYVSNSAIEGLTNSSTLTPSVKQQLLGEAKFMRAFCYFYLVNLYGDVPLILSTDWKINSSLMRTSKAEVYSQIIKDLKDAENLLNSKYLKADVLTSSSERIRPTKWAAAALLARTYLYNSDWTNAELEASSVITNSLQFTLTSLNNVFKKNNTEVIWQLQSVGLDVDANTGEGKFFILPAEGPNTSDHPIYLNDAFVKSFEQNDQRRANWVDSTKVGNQVYFYPYKYKIDASGTTSEEYCTVLRLGEVYLIRAEARAQLGEIADSQDDLNKIRNRAGLLTTSANSKDTLLSAIFQERRFELFTEWGHRWFDLKRSGMVDGIMPPVALAKGGSWQTTDQLYPIPKSEIQKGPQLTQNPGY